MYHHSPENTRSNIQRKKSHLFSPSLPLRIPNQPPNSSSVSTLTKIYLDSTHRTPQSWRLKTVNVPTSQELSFFPTELYREQGSKTTIHLLEQIQSVSLKLLLGKIRSNPSPCFSVKENLLSTSVG